MSSESKNFKKLLIYQRCNITSKANVPAPVKQLSVKADVQDL